MTSATIAPTSEKYFHTGDLAIAYAEWSPPAGGARAAEAPPVLLVHGLSSWRHSWDPVLPMLTGRRHVYAIDLRGHGRSGRAAAAGKDPVRAYGRKAYSDDAGAFLEKVIGRPSHIIGHSLGGLAVLGVAAGWPQLVKSLVMEDPPLFSRDRRSEGQTARSIEFEANARLAKSDLTAAQIEAELRRRTPPLPEANIPDLAKRLLMMDGHVWDAVFSGAYANHHDSDPLLRAVRSPSLLLQAEPSLGAAMTDDEAAVAMELVPAGAKHVKWDDSPHGMHTTFPQRFVEQVEAFFAAS